MSRSTLIRSCCGIAALGLVFNLQAHEGSGGASAPVNVADTNWFLTGGILKLNVKKLGKYIEFDSGALLSLDALPPEAEPGTLPEFEISALNGAAVAGAGSGGGVPSSLFGGVYEVTGHRVTLLPNSEELAAFLLQSLLLLQAEGYFDSDDEIVLQNVTIIKSLGKAIVKETEEVRTMKAQVKATFLLTGTVNGIPAETKGSFQFKTNTGVEQLNGPI